MFWDFAVWGVLLVICYRIVVKHEAAKREAVSLRKARRWRRQAAAKGAAL